MKASLIGLPKIIQYFSICSSLRDCPSTQQVSFLCAIFFHKGWCGNFCFVRRRHLSPMNVLVASKASKAFGAPTNQYTQPTGSGSSEAQNQLQALFQPDSDSVCHHLCTVMGTHFVLVKSNTPRSGQGERKQKFSTV